MTATTAYRRTTAAAPSKKRKRTSSICSSSSESNLDWGELTEVLWDCMRPHVQRMAVVNAAAEENNPPGSPGSCGRAFTMPWKAIWEQFIEITGTDVGRRSVQARGRTLISKRHKGERRHRWIATEDDELLRAFGAVEQQCLSRGEPHVSDMDDKEKTVFWDCVYNCTTVRRTKKSMRERHLILEARGNSAQSVHTSGTAETAVKQEECMMIEPLDLSAPLFNNNMCNSYNYNNSGVQLQSRRHSGQSVDSCGTVGSSDDYMMIEPLDLSAPLVNNNYNYNNNVVQLQPIAVKQEELNHSLDDGQFGLEPAAYFEIANMMEAWGEEEKEKVPATSNNKNNYINNYNNYYQSQEESVPNFGLCKTEESKFDEFVASDAPWTLQQPLAAGMC